MAMRTGSRRGGLNATINVTPLADVVLVLVIIVMLNAPSGHGDGPIQMPAAAHAVEMFEPEDGTVVTIDSRGAFYVNAMPVAADNLISQLQRLLDDKKEKLVYLKGDEDAKYSAVMDAMDALRKAQIDFIALITATKHKPAGAPGAR